MGNKGTIGKVTKLDFNTNNEVRGRFARMAVYVNLEKALISQVLVNGVLQRVEYKYLPTVYFTCGHYDHLKELCPNDVKRLKDLEGKGVNGMEE